MNLLIFKSESISHFNDVKYTNIRGYLTYLNEKKLSKNSINNRISCLRSFYKYLVKEELAENNPMILVENIKTTKRNPDFCFLKKWWIYWMVLIHKMI